MSALLNFLLQGDSRLDKLAKDDVSLEEILEDPDILTSLNSTGSPLMVLFVFF